MFFLSPNAYMSCHGVQRGSIKRLAHEVRPDAKEQRFLVSAC